MKLQTWLDINMKTISVILDEEDLKVVCAQKNTEWTAVTAQVARLAASSVLGRVVFEKGLLFCAATDFSRELAAKMDVWKPRRANKPPHRACCRTRLRWQSMFVVMGL